MNNKLIVLGLSATSKYVAKEAYELGIDCYGFDTKKGCAYYSRYFIHTQVISEQTELLEFLKNQFLNTSCKYYVCPTSDEWVEFINQTSLFNHEQVVVNKDYISGKYQLLADKKQLQNLSRQLGLAYPKSVVFSAGDILPQIHHLEFPLFCKPTNRAGLSHIMKGKKGWVINSHHEFNQLNELEAIQGVELIAQEIIEGPETNIKVLGTVASGNDQNDIMKYWTGCKARQYPPNFGSGSLVVYEYLPEMIKIAQTLIKHIKYEGFFALECKYCNKRNQLFIIEVNTRPSLWFGITTSSQSQFLAQWVNSFKIDKIDVTIPEKVIPTVWRYWYKDVIAHTIARKNSNQLEIDYPLGYMTSFAVWDRKDMKPFFYDLWNGITKLIYRKVNV